MNRISAAVGISSMVGVYLLARNKACSEASAHFFSQINIKNFEKLLKF